MAALEADYAARRLPTYPETFDGYVALTNPAAAEIGASNFLMETIANKRAGPTTLMAVVIDEEHQTARGCTNLLRLSILWRFCPNNCPAKAEPFWSVVRCAYVSGVFVVGVAGFEPATPSSRTRCAMGRPLKVR